MSAARTRVGWIGLGNIGLPMAQRVVAAGFPLEAWARHAAQTVSLAAAGATCAPDPETLAARCEVVVTIVGGPDDVRTLHERMLPRARQGTLFVEMSTASGATAASTQALARATGTRAIDAPVTGGVAGARDGRLTAFAGGEKASLDLARPVLDAFCARVVHAGDAGSGYRMKLVNQTMIAGILLGLAHGAALARACGFDAPTIREALRGGTAGGFLFESYVERMIDQAGPATFTLGMLHKDLRLARDEARAQGIDAGFHDAAIEAVGAACSRHGTRAGVQALAAGDRHSPHL
jgi:3-hydroxyisobutyrate dehydrogenase-like beta-hydroxyacid dehydrogenase